MQDGYNIVKDFIKSKSFDMLKEGTGVFKHPFIDPGAGYEENLWDWDSYFSALSLYNVCNYFNLDSERAKVFNHAKGNILNFFDQQQPDGFIAMVTTARGLFSSLLKDEHNGGKAVNQHKPFLCQGTLNASRFGSDYNWFEFSGLEKYMQFYEKNQYDSKSGLFFWRNDVMIGIDNNPTVFGRPNDSIADIYLNCFMYLEYQALSELYKARKNSLEGVVLKKAEALKAAIRSELYDERDGLYYSADINIKTHRSEIFHHGIGAFWKTTPIKIRIWACFLPMMVGISTSEENNIMINRHYLDPKFLAPFGVRTVAADEKMYNTVKSSNPSNWLGPIWIVVNYCVFKGLLNAGRRDLAIDLADRTIKLLAKDITENGSMSESYVPESGEKMMYGGFLNWNCLAIAMLKELERDENL